MEESSIIPLIKTVSSLPLVKINREEFLAQEFGLEYSSILTEILEKGPYKAGVSQECIERKIKACINFETGKATALSFAAGLPGGFAMIGTIPADVTQFMGHALRITQKVTYLSGMPSFSNIEDMTDEEANMVLVYLGVMFGSSVAVSALNEICKIIGANTLKQLPKIALTKVLGYQVAKQILKFVGIKLTKDTAIKGISKIVPVLGGFVSGTVTFSSLKFMSGRLHKELSKIHFNSN